MICPTWLVRQAGYRQRLSVTRSRTDGSFKQFNFEVSPQNSAQPQLPVFEYKTTSAVEVVRRFS